MKPRKRVWHYVTMLLSVIELTCGSEYTGDCRCERYDNNYMYCNCCPEHHTNGEKFKISYFYRKWGSRTSQVVECGYDRDSQDPKCDCIFCGRITDKSHKFYGTCDEREPQTDFRANKTYIMNVTRLGITPVSYTYEFKSGVKILIPSPPSFNKEPVHRLLPNDSVAMDISWTPHADPKGAPYIFTIKWKALEIDLPEMVARTEDLNMTLIDLVPNMMYNITISAKHPESIYESKSVYMNNRSMEKKPDKSPELFNFQVTQCTNHNECYIAIFWKPLALKHQPFKCTGYAISVTGTNFAINQSADCNDVMTQIGEPLSGNSSYDITLRYLSKLGSSPPSYMKIPAQEEVEGLRTPNVIIERNNSFVTVNISWKDGEPRPTHYKILYCKGTRTEKCQENTEQQTIKSNSDGGAILTMSNPGQSYLYNIATYWENVTSGIEKHWLCVFDACGDLLQPELSLIDRQEDSLSVLIKEAACPVLHKERGRPLVYEVKVLDADSSKVLLTQSVEAFGPVNLPFTSLVPNHLYIIRTTSRGKCHSSLIEKSFKTLKSKQPPMTIALVAIPLLLLVSVPVGIGICLYRRRIKQFRRILAAEGLDNRSVLSWLEKNDRASLDERNNNTMVDSTMHLGKESIIPDSDSGIHDEDAENTHICCPCKNKRWWGTSVGSKTPKTTLAVISSNPSVPSHDSGQSGDNSVPSSPLMPNINWNQGMDEIIPTDIKRDEEMFASPVVTNDNNGSGFVLHNAQPLTSASNDNCRTPGMDKLKRVRENANSVADSDTIGEDKLETDDLEDRSKTFIPHAVFVPGIDLTDAVSSDEEGSVSIKHFSGNSDYECVCDNRDSERRDYFNGSYVKPQYSEDSCDESDTDVQILANISIMVDGTESIKNKDKTVTLPNKPDCSECKLSDIYTPSKQLVLSPSHEDSNSQSNCNHETLLKELYINPGSNCNSTNDISLATECHDENGDSINWDSSQSQENESDSGTDDESQPKIVVVLPKFPRNECD